MKDLKEMTQEDFETELSNEVYKAGLWFERAEGVGLIYGNGHHMAQKLACYAVQMLQDQIKGKK